MRLYMFVVHNGGIPQHVVRVTVINEGSLVATTTEKDTVESTRNKNLSFDT